MVCIFCSMYKEMNILWEEKLEGCQSGKDKLPQLNSLEEYRKFLLDTDTGKKFWFFICLFVQEVRNIPQELFQFLCDCWAEHLSFIHSNSAQIFHSQADDWTSKWEGFYGED